MYQFDLIRSDHFYTIEQSIFADLLINHMLSEILLCVVWHNKLKAKLQLFNLYNFSLLVIKKSRFLKSMFSFCNLIF
jgi:hypothetical protein